MGLSPSKPAPSQQSPEVAAPATNSRLLSLPAELRLNIYRELLTPQEIVSRRQGRDIPDVEINEPAILAVCRLLRQEAEPIFYDDLKLVLDSTNLFDPPRDIMRSLDLIGEAQLQQIRRIDIPFGGKIFISICFGNKVQQEDMSIHRGTAKGAAFHILVTSSHAECNNEVCTAMAECVRDFLLCLIVHRARIKICGSIGPCRAVRMKASAIEKQTKAKGEKLEFLKRSEIQELLSHLKFYGKHLLREARLLEL
ncbi:hypothetical protein CLAFUW4_07211 [Fulvia fulva]|uniref:Uncharacterized protein n=1 Tax=Passalora fulva TaxID=5499 RepID=A0A9Q8UR78_PASFU|nr:uncharacterized protein CLAFUR5_07345 [Fulvia fulva]KAK4622171.1 hypothetical protein CLAFUR4_07219 [Fulvia fulva]KAK4622645.1 hypothetical protein CLAFUR0_07216 [Fulvia fulva]UJO19436.1 hypothetical protein CLAFUR5_07345 [Fulvia fulva]WPV16351.1 hypothetical protein CLAFUW4_07211 [Fulvia fulva]WPV30648.1 hypothetical protein CLAFUW7_07212 [Fulvia fulva]